MEEQMQNNNGNAKQKDWVLFQYDASNEKAIKIDFSGNVNLDNGNKGTILGVKGQSRDGNTKFIKIFSQTAVLFKGDDGKFTHLITVLILIVILVLRSNLVLVVVIC